MNKWTQAGKGINELVGARQLVNATAVFRYPMGELTAPYYEQPFHKMAELALTESGKAVTTILRPEIAYLPDILIADAHAVRSLEEGLSLREINHRRHIGKILGCHRELVPLPLGSAFLYAEYGAPLRVHVQALARGAVKLWNGTEETLIVKANWSRAFSTTEGDNPTANWDAILLPMVKKA